jgi:hypothetical protein
MSGAHTEDKPGRSQEAGDQNNIKISPQRVWRMLVMAFKDFFQDSGSQWAAAIAYYTLLSLFPLLLAAREADLLTLHPAICQL